MQIRCIPFLMSLPHPYPLYEQVQQMIRPLKVSKVISVLLAHFYATTCFPSSSRKQGPTRGWGFTSGDLHTDSNMAINIMTAFFETLLLLVMVDLWVDFG